MQEFDFTIYHIEGKKNVRADTLSRKDGEENKKGDNLQEVILPEYLFRTLQSHCMGVMAVNSPEEAERVRDPICFNRKMDFWTRQINIHTKKKKEKVIKKNNKEQQAKHPGTKRMIKKLKKEYVGKG